MVWEWAAASFRVICFCSCHFFFLSVMRYLFNLHFNVNLLNWQLSNQCAACEYIQLYIWKRSVHEMSIVFWWTAHEYIWNFNIDMEIKELYSDSVRNFILKKLGPEMERSYFLWKLAASTFDIKLVSNADFPVISKLQQPWFI